MSIYKVKNISAQHPRFRRRVGVKVKDMGTGYTSRLPFSASRIIDQGTFDNLNALGLISLEEDPGIWEKKVRLFAKMVGSEKSMEPIIVPVPEQIIAIDKDDKKEEFDKIIKEASLLIKDRKYEETVSLLEKAIDLYPALAKKGKIDKWIDEITETNIEQTYNEFYINAKILVEEEKIEEAIELLNKMIETYSVYAERDKLENYINVLQHGEPTGGSDKLPEESTGKGSDNKEPVIETEKVNEKIKDIKVTEEGTDKVSEIKEEAIEPKKVIEKPKDDPEDMSKYTVDYFVKGGMTVIRDFKSKHGIKMPGWNKKNVKQRAQFLVDRINKENSPK